MLNKPNKYDHQDQKDDQLLKPGFVLRPPLIKSVIGLRVSEEGEYEGVDLVECGQEAYPEFTKS